MTQEQISTGDRDLEIAWAGGLFEGEGSFVLSVFRTNPKTGRIYKSAQASLTMTDLKPVERFHAAVEMGRMHGPYYPKNPNHKRFWRWAVNGPENVALLLAMLEPYLCERRINRAMEVIGEATNGRPLPSRRQPTPPGRVLRVAPPAACSHGHPYDEPNTYITPSGGYQCRACKRGWELVRSRRIRAEAKVRAQANASGVFDE